MSFCKNFPYFYHSWYYNIQETIVEAETGEIRRAVCRWCPCGVSQINDRNGNWDKTEYWLGWGCHKKVINLISFLINDLQNYGYRTNDPKLQKINEKLFEGTETNFLIKSENGKVLCKIVTDILKTQQHVFHEYTRYRIFTFEIKPTKLEEKLILATFNVDALKSYIISLINKN